MARSKGSCGIIWTWFFFLSWSPVSSTKASSFSGQALLRRWPLAACRLFSYQVTNMREIASIFGTLVKGCSRILLASLGHMPSPEPITVTSSDLNCDYWAYITSPVLEPVLGCKAVWNTALKVRKDGFSRKFGMLCYLVKGVWMLSRQELYLGSPVCTIKAFWFSGQILSSTWKQRKQKDHSLFWVNMIDKGECAPQLIQCPLYMYILWHGGVVASKERRRDWNCPDASCNPGIHTAPQRQLMLLVIKKLPGR